MKPIMFVGTGSDVGKSMISTGFCRLLKQKGFNPAPFKAQNMSLNSYVTPLGLEIGRAQAVQAEACGVVCDTRMNPVLLKPTSQKSTQIVLHGKPLNNQSTKDYLLENNKQELFKEVKKAFNALQKDYFPIVLEGAGSISELNLKNRDIVNMRMAKHANAVVYLIADIEKGGVFASVYGTIALLEPWEKALIKGIIINKFCGDTALFDEGKQKIEELTEIPVLGVIPYAEDIYIEEEDSVALSKKHTRAIEGSKINIAVIKLPHLSNYTDFNVLEKDERTHLYYTGSVEEIAKADMIILPGTKNTLADLDYIQQNGIASAIFKSYLQNKKVIGICGGYQMMGQWVKDPLGVEGEIKELKGLEILPITTTLSLDKKTLQQSFYFKDEDKICLGYEIHMGITKTDNQNFLLTKKDGKREGYWLNNNCWGTYMHGILDNPSVIDDLLGSVLAQNKISYKDFKECNYNKLANLLAQTLDVDFMIESLKND